MTRSKRKPMTLGIAGAAMAAAGLAIASGVVILTPAVMTGQVSLGGETVTRFTVGASSNDGFSGDSTFTSNPYSLTLESGHNYSPYIQAYITNSTADESYLRVNRSTTVLVDQSAPATVDFNYPTVRHIDYTVNVTGGTISSYSVSVYGSANIPDVESHFGSSYKSFSPEPASTTGWMPMIPQSQVYVYGTVHLRAADGTQLTRSLTAQTVDVSAGPATVTWNIDLATTGTLTGDIELTPGTNVGYHYVYFSGIGGTGSQGVSAYKYVSANASYSMDLPRGDYDVFTRTYFTTPNHYVDTIRYRVTVTANTATTQDFIESLGTGRVPLTVDGFYTNADLSSSTMTLVRPGTHPYTESHHFTPVNGQYDFSLPSGDWKRSELTVSLYNNSDPQFPLNILFYRSHHTNDAVSMVTVPAGMKVDLGTEHVTLVKSNAYFDVLEASAQDPQILLSSPYIYLYQDEYNSDGSTKPSRFVLAFGSPEARGVSALTLVAEPGTYTMLAYATVNGSQTRFNGSSITFGQPVNTPAGQGVEVTPISSQNSQVTLKFSDVDPRSDGKVGVTTVVETPLGPAPPEGLKAHCPEDTPPDFPCAPTFYDIKTTANYGGAPVTVCVRMKLAGGNGISEFLHLYHYNEDLADPTLRWEELPAPTDRPRVTDCIDDPVACGCAGGDPAGCGVDFNVDPPVLAYMVCGVTTSFSPFTILKGDLEFTNTVNGVSYEGTVGPPSPQTWTVPATGKYRITALGASGGAATQNPSTITGGLGAKVSGEFPLQGGTTVQILVGQKGTSTPYSGGGGGASFVVVNGNPLLIGGGGGGVRSGATASGRNASINSNGIAGSTSSGYTSGFVAGGTNGSGGQRLSSYGSGGGGWSGNGASDGTYGEGGFSFLNGGKGGVGKSCGGLAHGGYGGGGAGNGCYGGGGGGGYSGGGGGRVGGGGGSWNAGTNRQDEENLPSTPSGHGIVIIDFIGQ